jgi:hypothetical protein
MEGLVFQCNVDETPSRRDGIPEEKEKAVKTSLAWSIFKLAESMKML